MQVKELIEKLKELPQDVEVGGYATNAEASFLINKIEVVTEENAPYDKGDGLYHDFKHGKTLKGQSVVILSGWD
jgi:hypothetical protein